MALNVAELLSEMVRIPSVNPMGRPVSGDQYFEYAMTSFLERLFQRLGWPYELQEVEPKRTNIVARVDGASRPEDGGPLVVFEAHQDTVPVDGMTIPPWCGDIRDGRVHGRGACDIKGGMASMITALSRLAEQKPSTMPTICMACTINEELGSSGAKQLAKSWADGKSKLVPRVPDAVIVAEPTLLDVVVAHRGVSRWRCHTIGKAAHSSQPKNGDNAIYQMSRVALALEEYANNVVGTLAEHPLVGRPTLSVGTIVGGISVNTVPDSCTIEIDRRLLPGEQPQAARQHVIEYLARQLPSSCKLRHDDLVIGTLGLPDTENRQLGERLARSVRSRGHAGNRVGVPYGTDAPAFAAVRAPVVVFGPGSIVQAHTCDEWVEIEQLNEAVEILVQFGQDW